MTTRSREAGMSLIEITITLSVMMMLTAVLAPAGMNLVEQAREFQVAQDCSSLRSAMVKMMLDTNQTRLRLQQGRGTLVDLLVTSGGAPAIGDGGDARWTQAITVSGTTDLVDRYLVENLPAGNAVNAWPAPAGVDGSGWRGAYLRTPPATDPWGHRYAINVQHFNTRDDVIVLSAGRDGVIDTPFAGRGVTAGGDDRYVLVR
ncbi:MAG: hypothetical protein NTY02_04790 [Acidobacteria bacterium]|nr:hypothetical protein [Acidobacteriota bacterium]